MTKKDICLIALVVGLGGWYVIRFTDWFKHDFIRIQQTARVLPEAGRAYGRVASNPGKPVQNVTFSFGKAYRLTSVKVVVADDGRTNKFPHALWELVAPEGSQPVDGIAYGHPVAGMKPAFPGAEAKALVPGVEYRLLVEARSMKGTNDFTLPGSGSRRR